MHIMPVRFVRIRRYGIYNHTTIRNMDLQFVPTQVIAAQKMVKIIETPSERIKRLTGFDSSICPVCKKGKMIKIREIPRIRSPTGHLPTILLSKLL